MTRIEPSPKQYDQFGPVDSDVALPTAPEVLPEAPDDARGIDIVPPQNDDVVPQRDSRSPFEGIRNFWDKRAGKISILGGGTLLAAGLTFMGLRDSIFPQADKPDPAATAPANPGQPTEAPNPSESAEPSPSATPEASAPVVTPELRAEMQTYTNMDGNVFDNLPEPEQLRWWNYITQEGIGGSPSLAEYSAGYYEFTHNPLDIMPANISIDSTPQEIATIDTLQLRFIFSLPPSARENALLAVLHLDYNSPKFQEYMKLYEPYFNAVKNPKVLASKGILPVGVVQSATDVATNSGETYRTLTFADGTTDVASYVESEDPITKQPIPAWIPK